MSRTEPRWLGRFCRKRQRGLLLLIAFLLLPCWTTESGAQAKPAKPVRLVLLLVIDQARVEYLERLRPIFKRGMKRLLDEGIQFTDAHQDHAMTSTGPGHASLATGLFPSHSGIVGNAWFDRQQDRRMYCVEDEASPLLPTEMEPSVSNPAKSSSGRSPRNLLGTALPDWLKQANPRSKAFGVSRKDRSAVLLGGKQADGAFWYDGGNGDLITSRYYLERYPQWMRDFLDRKIPDSYFGQTWKPRPVDSETLKRLAIEEVDEGLFTRGFPHPLGGASLRPDARFYGGFGSSPYFEDYLLAFVRDLIEAEELGRDNDVDYVGVGLSVMDSVGHRYGPNSREVLDTWIRLDEGLGELFDYLDQKVGMDRVLISLSADHGVLTLPEYLSMKQQPGGRGDANDVVCFQSTMRRFEKKFGRDIWWTSPVLPQLRDPGPPKPAPSERRERDRSAARILLHRGKGLDTQSGRVRDAKPRSLSAAVLPQFPSGTQRGSLSAGQEVSPPGARRDRDLPRLSLRVRHPCSPANSGARDGGQKDTATTSPNGGPGPHAGFPARHFGTGQARWDRPEFPSALSG